MIQRDGQDHADVRIHHVHSVKAPLTQSLRWRRQVVGFEYHQRRQTREFEVGERSSPLASSICRTPLRSLHLRPAGRDADRSENDECEDWSSIQSSARLHRERVEASQHEPFPLVPATKITVLAGCLTFKAVATRLTRSRPRSQPTGWI